MEPFRDYGALIALLPIALPINKLKPDFSARPNLKRYLEQHYGTTAECKIIIDPRLGLFRLEI